MLQPEEIGNDKVNEQIELLENSLHDHTQQKKEMLNTGLVSDLFDRNILETLKSYFEQSSFRHNSLPAEQFKALISQYIPRPIVDSVYRSIDVNDVGYVNYSDFTNYLIASEAGSSFSAKIYISRLVPMLQQEDDASIMHRDGIDCIAYVKRPCPMIITGGRDGQLSIWDPDNLLLMKNIEHLDKNAVYKEELRKSMDGLLRAQTKAEDKYASNVKMSITAMCPILNWGLLCVGSADSCVTVYELGNQEVCGRITDLDTIPSAIECFQLMEVQAADGNNTNNNNNNNNNQNNGNPNQNVDVKSFIAIGDSKGMVHLIKLHPEFGNSTEVGMKKKNQILFAQSVKENYSKIQVHNEWITSIHYISEVNSLITASVDSTMKFVDVSRKEITKVFTGHQGSTRIGINSFRWSSVGKYLASGADRTLLFWDPFTLEIMNRNDSLRSPIIGLEVCDQLQKVFAALSNKTILVWHNITFELLQSITDNTIYKPTNTLASMIFVTEKNMMYTAGNRISAWTLEKSSEGIVNVDDEDLCTVLYNNIFNQILVVKALGTFKIYQAETGEIVRQFMVRPIDPMTAKPVQPTKDRDTGVYLPLILHACLDKNQTRLIVVGSNLSVQYWNIHDGSNLVQVNPQLYSTSLAHVYSMYPKTVVSITQDVLFLNTNNQQGGNNTSGNDGKKNAKAVKVLLIGTEFGHVCVFHEHQAVIEPVPNAFLRVIDQDIELNHNPNLAKFKPNRQNNKRKFSLRGVALKAHQVAHVDNDEGDGEQQQGDEDDTGGGDEHSSQYLQGHSQVSQPSILSHQKSTVSSDKQQQHHSSSLHGSSHPHGSQLHTPHPPNHNNHKRELEMMKDPVIWMHLIPNSTYLFTCYLSGRMVVWDLETDHKIQDFYVKSTGAILNAMKMKNQKVTIQKQKDDSVPSSSMNLNSMAYAINTAVNNKLLNASNENSPTKNPTEEAKKTDGTTNNDRRDSIETTDDTTTVDGENDGKGSDSQSQNSSTVTGSRQRQQPLQPPSNHRQSAFARKVSTNSYAKHKKLKNSVLLSLPENEEILKRNAPDYQPQRLESMILAADHGPLVKGVQQPIIEEDDDEDEENEEGKKDDEQSKDGKKGKKKGKSQRKTQMDDEEYYNPDDHDPIFIEKSQLTDIEGVDDFTNFKNQFIENPEEDDIIKAELAQQKQEQERIHTMKDRLQKMIQQQQLERQLSMSKRKDSAAITINKHVTLLQGNKLPVVEGTEPSSSNSTTHDHSEKDSHHHTGDRKDSHHHHQHHHKGGGHHHNHHRHHHKDDHPHHPVNQNSAVVVSTNNTNQQMTAVYNEEMKNYAKFVKQSIHSVHKWSIRMNQPIPSTTNNSSEMIQSNLMENIKNYIQNPEIPPKLEEKKYQPGMFRPLSMLEENSLGSLEEGSSIIQHSSTQHNHHQQQQNKPQNSNSALLPSNMMNLNLSIESSTATLEDDSTIASLPKKFPLPPSQPIPSNTRTTFSNTLRQTMLKTTPLINNNDNPEAKPGQLAGHDIDHPLPPSPDKLDDHSPNKKGKHKKASISIGSSVHSSSVEHSTTSHPHNSSTHSTSSSTSTPKIIVDHLVILPETKVMIGACNDRYLRFFDLDTLEILCSCLYISLENQDDNLLHQIFQYNVQQNQQDQQHKSHNNNNHHHLHGNTTYYSSNHSKKIKIPDTILPDEVIRLLTVSDSEDLLIGAYDSGVVRVWSIHSYSVVTLRNLLYKHIQNKLLLQENERMNQQQSPSKRHGRHPKEDSVPKGDILGEFGDNLTLAISPLALLSEFKAHICPILSLEYIWFDYESDLIAQSVNMNVNSNTSSNGNNNADDPETFDTPRFWGNNNNSNLNNNNSYEQSLLSPVSRQQTQNNSNNGNTSSNNNNPIHGRKHRIRQSDMGQEILEGYVVTAGLDQRIFMWTIYGKCVGEFGTFGWDINNENTWNLRKYNPYDAAATAAITGGSFSSHHHSKKKNQSRKFGNTVTSVLHNLSSLMEEFPGITNPQDLLILKKYKPKKNELNANISKNPSNPNNPPPVTLSLHPKKQKYEFNARNITKDSLLLKDSSSKNLLPSYLNVTTNANGQPTSIEPINGAAVNNVISSSGIPMKEMHTYVERLTKKIINRPPAYEQVNAEYQGTAKKHPIVPVNRNRKTLDLKKQLKNNTQHL